MNRPILHLNLSSEWYDMIKSGSKLEEYRELKPYYQRIFSSYIKIKGKQYHPTDVDILFSNGYRKDRRQMKFNCAGLSVKEGNPEWGASPGKEYFALKLGSPC